MRPRQEGSEGSSGGGGLGERQRRRMEHCFEAETVAAGFSTSLLHCSLRCSTPAPTQTAMAAEESRSGKRRRDLEALDEGSSAQEAAWEQAEVEEEAGAAAGDPAAAGGTAAAAGGALGPAAPTLFEVLTRLLVLDRSIRAAWS